jgi:hypothetical protein
MRATFLSSSRREVHPLFARRDAAPARSLVCINRAAGQHRMSTPQSLSERLRDFKLSLLELPALREEAAAALDAKDALLAQADRALELSASVMSRASGAMAAEDPILTEVHQLVCVTLAAIRATLVEKTDD